MQQILFIELLGGIGDVLIALPAIQALAKSHPNAKLTVLTFPPTGQLLETDPFIHQVVYAIKGKARQAVEALINQQKFDLIVSDTNYDRIDQVVSKSDASRVITNLWRSPPPDQFVSDRFIEILLSEEVIVPSAVAPPELHLTLEERRTAQAKLGWSHSIVMLCPDAGMEIKRWSELNFIELGRALQKKYRVAIVIPVGSDENQAVQIVKGIGGNAQLWQQGTLRELAAMMSHADLMIASDTGPARIAAAVGVPTITLFGPSWHERYGQPAPHVNLQGYPDCPERVIQNFTVQCCWYSGKCPFEKWATCVNAISVDRVLASADLFLKTGVEVL